MQTTLQSENKETAKRTGMYMEEKACIGATRTWAERETGNEREGKKDIEKRERRREKRRERRRDIRRETKRERKKEGVKDGGKDDKDAKKYQEESESE